ncbi:MAG: endo alpha-1,4 polygalactosaminidase [Myxococcales bacterium]|nr:endo alpha-1,4 polygalactosaminidase [Myxococcales bacterium]
MSRRLCLWTILLSALVLAPLHGCDQDSGDDDDNDTGGDDTGDECGNPDDANPGEPAPHGEDWEPSPGTAWQWQLTGAIDSSYDVTMYDIDLVEAPAATIDALHAAGRVVICYFSAGSWEEWRDDAGEFPAAALGNPLEGWPDERWLDINNQEVRRIMGERLDLAVEKECDGVEPDNVDGFANDNGLGLTAEAQLAYNRWLADEAHQRGLSVGLKNDLCQLENLRDWFDWALNEECVAYDECGLYDDWLAAGKAVFHVEYVDDWAAAPAKAAAVCGVRPAMDTLIKTWDLGPERLACSDQ